MSDKEKKCFKCGQVKSLSEFYKHKGCVDGCLNKCKCCTKSDVAAHRSLNIERIREYDRRRGNRHNADYLREYRKTYPNKYKAQTMVNNALRDGRLKKETACSECDSGFSVHAHHDDYSFPLTIRWLCAACHSQWHSANGESPNG